ncbi:MAG: Outer membrane protein assembly factor BamA [Gemmatimonadaceae bacterium]|nr:Outer membrane protein assembly factor BamA [Gemmatimonadaceae bacterium]
MPDPCRVIARAVLGLAIWAVATGTVASRVGAQAPSCDGRDLEVRSLEFVGNRAFRSSELARRIVTTPSTLKRRFTRFLGRRYCLDSLVVRTDSLRLVKLYRDIGFTDVRVGLAVRLVAPKTVAVRFTIAEGTPMRVDSVTVTGLGSVPNADRLIRGIGLRRGDRFDKILMDASRDTLARRLRDQGYPLAEVLRSFETDTAARKATVEYSAITGPRARLGQIRVRIDSSRVSSTHVDPNRLRSVLGIGVGNLYRERALEGAKRGLYLTDAFRHVDISVDSASLADGDSLVTIDVTATEGELKSTRVSAGWGNLDCGRTQGEYSDFNFLGRLLRLDLTGRLSKIGTGYPFDFASALCTAQVTRDPLSDTLNYYVGATFSQAALYRLRYVPTVTIYSERRSEYSAFLRDTRLGALASVFREGSGRWPMTFSYQMELGSTVAQPTFFCGVFQVCEVGEQNRLKERKRLATVGWTATRNTANNLADPTSGHVVRVELRHASPAVGSDPTLQFNRLLGDVSFYHVLFDGGTLALRLRAGAVIGTSLALRSGQKTVIPLQERMYAGGPNTVRGYRQNELGASLYVPSGYSEVQVTDSTSYWRANPDTTSERVVPSGGDNVAVANLEMRLRSFFLPELVQFALFVDAGEVWNRKQAGLGGFGTVKVTPGVGVRVNSMIGPIRVDIGYNPYARPAGPAYFTPNPSDFDPSFELQLICVSPGNALLVHDARPQQGGKAIPPTQEAGVCPATYRPARRASFLGRLTFNFSIGQAF